MEKGEITKPQLTEIIRKKDPKGLRFDSNLHLTVSYFNTYIQSYAPMLICYHEAAVLVTDIQSQCAKNENLQYAFVMHSLDFLLNSFENKDNISAQKYHFLLHSVSNEYRELEGFDKDNIIQFKERMSYSVLPEENTESFLSQTIRIFISEFLENPDLSYQIIAFKVDHYFTFVLFRIHEEEQGEEKGEILNNDKEKENSGKNNQCGVYICDSTLENGSCLEKIFMEQLEVVIFPKLSRQKDGYTCSIFSLLDVEILCDYIQSKRFMGLVQRSCFAPEMMVYSQNSESFQTFLLNMCPDHLSESIKTKYLESLNESNHNLFCFKKLCSLV